jgi:hypothetical protein
MFLTDDIDPVPHLQTKKEEYDKSQKINVILNLFLFRYESVRNILEEVKVANDLNLQKLGKFLAALDKYKV